MFSEIVSDSVLTQEEIDIKLENSFKTEKRENFLKFLDQTVINELSNLENQYKGNDPESFMAISILKYLGENPTGKICGVPSLGKVVFDVEKGIGCCSDYSKAWIFYAAYFNLKVREVNSLNHTTVEFYNTKLKKWIWLDPFNRAQFSMNNELLNQYEARMARLFDKVDIINLNQDKISSDLINYKGYNTSQLSLLLWRRGINFIEVEEVDAKLRSLKIQKPIRQLILLISGVSPGWLILTNDALASYLRILKLAIYILISSYFLLNLLLISKVYSIFKHSRQTSLIRH